MKQDYVLNFKKQTVQFLSGKRNVEQWQPRGVYLNPVPGSKKKYRQRSHSRFFNMVFSQLKNAPLSTCFGSGWKFIFCLKLAKINRVHIRKVSIHIRQKSVSAARADNIFLQRENSCPFRIRLPQFGSDSRSWDPAPIVGTLDTIKNTIQEL